MISLTDGGLLKNPPRHLFFTGKGGVGKTSLACATAIALADAGKRVLLVSTDPASNLDEVLGITLGRDPVAIPKASLLFALNIDPEAAARAYREKVIGPLRGQLPEAALRNIEEQLSGACTTEIAAFDEFARLIGDASATADYDHVVFDTAPTGHTLRLMLLPRAWTHYLDTSTTGTSCLGPLSGLDAKRSVYQGAVEALADAARTVIVLVTRAANSALAEVHRTRDELAGVGINNQMLVINGRFTATDREDPVALAVEERGSRALAAHARFLDSIRRHEVPLRAENLVGIDALRALFNSAEGRMEDTSQETPKLPATSAPNDLLHDIAASGRGVILTMGKGGVGKTTVAAGIAIALAKQGHTVHLTTTDPAANVASTLAGEVEGLTVDRIDPAAETAAYVEQVMREQGANLDAEARALLEEDLRSPCTEEIAVFRAFARAVDRGRDEFVVLDTAPTGHTLLLLDATQAYHRELGRQSRTSISNEVQELLPRLRDPDYCQVFIVTLPEATPVHEAAALQGDLRRAGIEPGGWIINQSLALTNSNDPLLRKRAANEHRFFEEVVSCHSKRTAALPWATREPVGAEALHQLFSNHHNSTAMPKFVYETVPSADGEKPDFFEIEQAEGAEALTTHPETGVAIKRVVVAGAGELSTKAEGDDDCCCGPSGCCD